MSSQGLVSEKLRSCTPYILYKSAVFWYIFLSLLRTVYLTVQRLVLFKSTFKKTTMRLALSALVFFVVAFVATAQETGESQLYNYYPYYGPNARFLITTTTTTTTVSTSTSTVTCTKAVVPALTNACRRRRGLLHDDEHEEQFPISPSAVQGY